MISANQLQSSYNKLYKEIRKYIWPANIVSDLADFEISVYRMFPDLSEVSDTYNKLKYNCLRYIDDEELKIAFENFREVLDLSSTVYSKLNSRLEGDALNENIQKENQK